MKFTDEKKWLPTDEHTLISSPSPHSPFFSLLKFAGILMGRNLVTLLGRNLVSNQSLPLNDVVRWVECSKLISILPWQARIVFF